MATDILQAYEFHPLANIFPLIDGQAYQDLMADILNYGVREPIWLYEGKILDGRNRYRAATAMRVEFETSEYTGDNPVAFVVSLNLHRRHLNESQRGMVAAKLANLENGQRASSANLPTIAVSQSDAADMLNVSTRTVTAAAKVQAEAPQEVSKAVEAGSVSINLASQFVALPDDVKQDAIEAMAEQSETVKEVMREAVKQYRQLGSGENEWYTPAEYADMAREVMGSIDLDPASCVEANEVIQASQFYTKEDDGLTKDWKGNLWINPPYSRDLMPAFVDKLKQSFINGDVDSAILLSHNNTDTAWFHSLASVSSAICFPKKRIKFYRGEEIAAPTNGQAFFYLGDNVGDFADIFGEVGFVVEPIPTEVVA
jgi:ParB-like chromosome segregation protein Spo0J